MFRGLDLEVGTGDGLSFLAGICSGVGTEGDVGLRARVKVEILGADCEGVRVRVGG